MSSHHLIGGRIAYGPDANCTLTTCPISASLYKYQPSLAANVTLLVLFGVALLAHVWRGVRWREWTFSVCMALGCVCEMVGYGGRIMLWRNPFDFSGFLMQIILITVAPVFFTAAIYILLSRIVQELDVSLSRVPPAFWWGFFITCDIVSLALQAAGGALSTNSSGKSQVGVNVAIAGLSFQVVTLFVFCAACIDYAVRYALRRRNIPVFARRPLPAAFKVFVACLTAGILLIFVRCAYRIDELSEGYSGPLISNQGLFIALEGAVLVAAVFVLLGANPGQAFASLRMHNGDLKGEKEIDGATSDCDRSGVVV